MRLTLIAGARPNFMKIAPIIEAINLHNEKCNDVQYRLVHTGQHYDKNMSEQFFEQLGIPQPHINLESGGGSQAEQTANIMTRFEIELNENPTDVVLVVGDVTSTLACSIVAKKEQISVVHVEAGIRSHDMSMPEEINRIVTDSISDHFFTTSEVANSNLIEAGVNEKRIHFVGNTMIDTLLKQKSRFFKPVIWDQFELLEKQYLILTLHRPANVDDPAKLQVLIEKILLSAQGMKIVFPVHPRTLKNLERTTIDRSRVYLLDPMSYLEFNYLVEHSFAVITDSGGITEEATVMKIPCLTLRNNTERPETVTIGTNELIGTNPDNIPPAMKMLFNGQWKKGGIPPLWDGKASERIVNILCGLYNKK